MIEIWQPRWHDKIVLIAKYKVKDGENKIKFTKAPQLPGVFSLDGNVIKGYPLDTNGKIPCYAVALKEFQGVSAL